MNLHLLPCNHLARRAVLGAFLSITCATASAASFDCAKARSKSERLICGDPKLSALDDRLGALAAAGKKRSPNPRAYQRELDDAWVIRQRCVDIACVEAWYANRIAALSASQPDAGSIADRRSAGVAPAATPPALPRPAPVGRPAPTVNDTDTINVKPGAQLQVIAEELGFHIPLTREGFLERYDAAGAKCGVSQQLSNLKALSRLAESDCWTGTQCPTPAAGLRCQILRTAYDSTGRIVLFTTTFTTSADSSVEAGRFMEKKVAQFAEFGGGKTLDRDTPNGRVVSATGSSGEFKLEAKVTQAESGVHTGTFSVGTR